MIKRVAVVLLAIGLLGGCATRITRIEQRVDKHSIDFKRLDYVLARTDEGIAIHFSRVYSADVETIVHKDHEGFGAAYADVFVGIATLGIVNLGDTREFQGTQHKTLKQPLNDGTPLTGYLKVVSEVDGRMLVSRLVAQNLRDSTATFRLPSGTTGCVGVDLRGDLNTLGRNLSVKVKGEVC